MLKANTRDSAFMALFAYEESYRKFFLSENQLEWLFHMNH